MRKKESKLAVLAMLLLSVSYGFAGYTARELQEDLTLWQQIALQNFVAILILTLTNLLLGKKIFLEKAKPNDLLQLFLRSFLGRILGSYFYIQACVSTSLANVGWLSALPMSVFFAWLLQNEKASKKELLYLLLSLLGIFLITLPGVNEKVQVGRGEIFALISCASIGLGVIYGRKSELGSNQATLWVLYLTTAIAAVMALLVDGSLALVSIKKVPILLTTAFMCLIGTFCTLYGYKHLKASVATAILSLEAIWAILFGFGIYQEIPSIVGVFGGSLIVLSAYKIQAQSKK